MADDEKLGEEEDLTLPSQRSSNNGGSVPASPASDAVAQLNAKPTPDLTVRWTQPAKRIAKWSFMRNV